MKKTAILAILLAAFYSIYSNAQTQLGATIYGTQNDERFGSTIEMNAQGNIIAVAADQTDTMNGNSSGLVRVFELNNATNEWTQKGNDILGRDTGNKFGHSISLSTDGNLIAIGAVLSDFYGFQSGSVWVFEYNDTSQLWEQKGSILTNGIDDYFTGNSVSFNGSGDRIAIGTPASQSSGFHRGNIIIFDFDQNTNDWVQVGSLINGTQDYTNLGYDVSLNGSGNTLVAGGPGIYTNGNSGINGVVKIFTFINNNWVQKGTDIIGNQPSNLFGGDVAISEDGNTIVVGALSDDQNSENSGKVEVYNYINSQWIKKGSSIIGNSNGDRLGSAVQINNDGSKILVGSIGFDNNKGKVELFEFSNNDWKLKENPIIGESNGDKLGLSITINEQGNLIGVGTSRNDATDEYFKVFNMNSTLDVINLNEFKVSLYLNEDKLYIKSNNISISKVNLYNSLGQEINVDVLESDFSKIHLTKAINTNVYFIKIQTNKGIISKKFLLKKV
ncbi:T9SS type A sorting domain-containing protein [Tenacibaculum amylolyticum]|uniref:T9SS type A sorting domain-containing protein n=1 Tax=Tenacibaculum amylolyticum TaxID=104269 RepID=UPI003894FB6C